MKKILSKIFFLLLFTSAFSFGSTAQIVVRVRPVAVVRVRPVAPSRRHVWVSNEYAYRNNRYETIDGYWALPPRGRTVWIDGRWRHRRGGWVWVKGHWR